MISLKTWEAAIVEADRLIGPYITRTPVLRSNSLSGLAGFTVWLKCEQLQPTGSFKIRGAANALVKIMATEQNRRAVTYSTGNHGLAVTYMCHQFGIGSTIFISHQVPENKVEKLRSLGADVIVEGDSQDEAQKMAEMFAHDQRLPVIPPFDDPAVIAGQGTIGLELLGQIPNLAHVMVPLSGGGLVSGIAALIKSRRPDIQVIGVSMERAPVMYESVRQGHPVELEEENTVADSLQGGIGLNNRYTFNMVQRMVDRIVLVSEVEISQAIAYLALYEGLIVEGAAAVVVACFLKERSTLVGPTALILTGRNVDFGAVCLATKQYEVIV